MAENLFRVTVDEPNYSRVLKHPVETKEIRNLPSALQSVENTRLWAINPGSGNEDTYQRLQPDDYILFYLGEKHRSSGEGLYVAVGSVSKKFRGDEDSARELFRNIHSVRMFTVEEFELVSKSKNDIKRILGYERHPQGSHRVREARYSSLDRVMDELRS